MKKWLLILSLLLVIIFFHHPRSSAVEVSGEVWGIWYPEENPFEVVGDLRIPKESTLAITPGCHIEFQGHYKFIVDTMATLQVIGTVSDSIIFRAADTSVGWYGLRFYSSAFNCRLEYCQLEYGKASDDPEPPLGSDRHGGAIYCENSNLTILDCTLQRNAALVGFGGAIYTDNSNLNVQFCEIKQNRCAFGGSGAYCGSAQVTLTDNLFDGNVTFYPLGGELGGAIVCGYSDVDISANIISNNFCGTGGGGLVLVSSTAEVTHNAIFYNRSWDVGAGVLIGASIVKLSHIVIAFNIIRTNEYEFYGAGIASHSNSHLAARNNTIVANQAGVRAGGIYIRNGLSDTLENNIVWGNIATESPQMYVEGPMPVARFNDFEGGWAGEGNIDANPLFVNVDSSNFNLTWLNYPIEDSTKSPCIDTGDPLLLDPDGTRLDMGALYYQRPDGIDELAAKPEDFRLMQNYPNPFNSSTIIEFDIPKEGVITISVYDILGRKAAEPLNEKLIPGRYSRKVDMGGQSSGVYFCVLRTEKTQICRKMILMK